MNFSGTVSPSTVEPYINHEFYVPEGTQRVRVSLEYVKPGICQLYLSVFAPNGYRGSRMLPAAIGAVCLELDLSASFASLGGIAGQIVSGTWRAQLDLERTAYTVDYTVKIELFETAIDETREVEAVEIVIHNTAGWYKGELHSHSHHSDGRTSVAEVVASARHHGLDFLSLTDHFTTAGWAELVQTPDLCLIQGFEITGHRGHANLHGLAEWVNPFVDEPQSWSINDAAKATHAQNGLFCVNHAFSLDLGWRYHEFDWNNCDLLEIYHHHEGEDNLRQLGLWDELLRAGKRITGVAGTDSHDPFRGRHRLGQVFTVVYATALERSAILAGLRQGAAYVTLGPDLGFTASHATKTVGMGETLEKNGAVRLNIEIMQLEQPARLVVLKNGWYFKHLDLSPVNHEIQLEDTQPETGYYRLELYARVSQNTLGSGRAWAQTLCLSNPIFMT